MFCHLSFSCLVTETGTPTSPVLLLHEVIYRQSLVNMFNKIHHHTVLTKSPLGDRYGFYFYLGKEEKPHLGGNTITADQWQTIFIKMDQNTR